MKVITIMSGDGQFIGTAKSVKSAISYLVEKDMPYLYIDVYNENLDDFIPWTDVYTKKEVISMSKDEFNDVFCSYYFLNENTVIN